MHSKIIMRKKLALYLDRDKKTQRRKNEKYSWKMRIIPYFSYCNFAFGS